MDLVGWLFGYLQDFFTRSQMKYVSRDATCIWRSTVQTCTLLCTVYRVGADVGLGNGKCDGGNGKQEICVVLMNTVQYYTVRLYICTCF